jgi:hypothetical protein
MSVKNGGPAFPGEPEMRFGESNEYNQGMTLRDYFAAKELTNMAGQIAVCDIHDAYARIANHCYRMADAMIAARETK